MTLDQLHAIAAKLQQLVNGKAIVSGQLVIHFDATGIAKKAQVSQNHDLTGADT